MDIMSVLSHDNCFLNDDRKAEKNLKIEAKMAVFSLTYVYFIHYLILIAIVMTI